VPGPMPRATVDALLDLSIPTQFIQGNGEREVLAQLAGIDTGTVSEQFREGIRWVGQELPPEDTQLLGGWAQTLRLGIPGLGDVLFCHATPRSDSEIFTCLTPEDRLLPVFASVDDSVVICRHTHMQFDRSIAVVRVVNAGSVGMPFGEPGAYWLLLGPGVELRYTPYDGAAAATHIRAMTYPGAHKFAARNVLQPHLESDMLELFEEAALG
jgi:hypothetical protein